MVSWFRNLSIVIAIMVAAGIMALVERGQLREHGHIVPRTNVKALPQLQEEHLLVLAEKLLEIHPTRAESNLLMAKAMIEAGKPDKALRYLEMALEAERHDQRLLFLYAQVLIDTGAEIEKVQAVVDEMRRYFPRTREKVETYFARAAGGRLRFDATY
ncbi:MAG TPA: tetratricopeptide repeat protein [Candidatus Latescibacteria bacterium]|jgi:predicted Zn-dependent protease|nr:tetratricopeptide repeat protein [Candidatus Latescibacterota bacterium]HJP33568.1 tetratricopeptide repeat protein [Candidatus Latescibacterota bacterium]